MILDKIENAPLYYSINPNLECALRFMVEHKDEFATWPAGSRQLSDNVSMKVISYNTVVGSRKWESHEEFTDVQYTVSGSERIGFNNAEHMVAAVKQPGKDQIIHEGDGDRIRVPEGYFIVMFPGEAHMSKLADGFVSAPAQKASFKVRL